MRQQVYKDIADINQVFAVKEPSYIKLQCISKKEVALITEKPIFYGECFFEGLHLALYMSGENILHLSFLNNKEELYKQKPLTLRSATQIVRDDERASRYWQSIIDRKSISLLCYASDFEERVLRSLLKLKPGYVASYKQLAEASGNPLAHRAVANVVANNPFAIVVPCHRVIYQNQSLGKYRYGSEIKKKLLEIEEATLLAAMKD
ncbi:MAG: methylated-DNA--[protein]-cysteine S-methyltransferase [Chlamydiales bacterium]|nr:MGMT family protein [Chlamydiales bacterium]NCF70805.1 methylated-DNA--[protein]-cysteine S-methyltransferase [Chlamydiales bacterium]